MTVKESYDQWSSTYDQDRNRTRDLDGRVVREIFGDRRFATIVEIGCGTGKNTSFFARIGEKVHAIDFSEGMIAQAREKLPDKSVAFSIADITRRWPCEDRSAGLVVCNLVLEHIEDIHPVFSEAYRTLERGGMFFVCELHAYRQYQGAKANFQRGEHTIEIPAFVHHISDFLAAAEQNGFTLSGLREWWHDDDQGQPPRLISLLFTK